MSAKRTIAWSSLAATAGLALGESAWALSRQGPDFAWLALSRPGSWALGAGLGLAWAWAQAAGWKLAFSLELRRGLALGALSALPFVPGLLWPWVQRFPLPPPHDLAVRKLQILLAVQVLGGLGLALALGSAALWHGRVLERLGPRRSALRLGGMALLAYQLSGLWMGQWNMTGDAPHYLLMAHSLAQDQDLDLRDDFQRREWRRFYDYPWDLKPQLQEVVRSDGARYSEHKPGLSLLLAPAYRLLDDSGAKWTLALLAALGGGLLYALALSLGFGPGQALLGWALFSLGAPWLTQSSCAMTELAGGLGLLAGLCALQGVLPWWTLFLPAAGLHWLHLRYTLPALGLAALAAWGGGKAGRRRASALLAANLLSLALTLALAQRHLGGIDPTSARQMPLSELFQPLKAWYHLLGMLLDQEYGLLPFAPVLTLASLGLGLAFQRDRAWAWRSAAVSAAYLLLVACFPHWWGNMAPNRFLAVLAPILTLWALEVWRAWGQRPLFLGLAAATWAWGLAMAVLPWLCYSKLDGRNWTLKILGSRLGLDATRLFPSYTPSAVDAAGHITYARPLGWASVAWPLGLILALFIYRKTLGPPKAA